MVKRRPEADSLFRMNPYCDKSNKSSKNKLCKFLLSPSRINKIKHEVQIQWPEDPEEQFTWEDYSQSGARST